MKRDPKPSRERAGCARGVRNWSDVKFHKRSSRMGRKVERCHWTLGDSLISNLGSYTRPVKLEDRTKTLKHASSPNIFLYIPRLFVRKLLQDAFHQNKGGNQKRAPASRGPTTGQRRRYSQNDGQGSCAGWQRCSRTGKWPVQMKSKRTGAERTLQEKRGPERRSMFLYSDF